MKRWLYRRVAAAIGKTRHSDRALNPSGTVWLAFTVYKILIFYHILLICCLLLLTSFQGGCIVTPSGFYEITKRLMGSLALVCGSFFSAWLFCYPSNSDSRSFPRTCRWQSGLGPGGRLQRGEQQLLDQTLWSRGRGSRCRRHLSLRASEASLWQHAPVRSSEKSRLKSRSSQAPPAAECIRDVPTGAPTPVLRAQASTWARTTEVRSRPP